MNGQLLSGDTVIANIKNGEVQPIVAELLPLCLARGGSFEAWLESRAVDNNRPNARILKRLIRLKEVDDVSTVLRAHAAVVTDNLWYCADGEKLSWNDVRYTENRYADVALMGRFLDADNNAQQSRTPELTNIGSFEKAWKLENGAWHLYKRGTAGERYSELVAYKIGCLLGFDMAVYEPFDGLIKSRDFTGGKLNFEPAASFVGDTVDEIKISDALRKLKPSLIKQYLDIVYLDALVFNPDRHTFNFGVLRDQNSGKVLSMAPNFDNNLCLISRGADGSPTASNRMLINDFIALVRHIPEAYPMPRQLSYSEISEVTQSVLPNEDVDRDFVAKLLKSRQQTLCEQLEPLQSHGFEMEQQQN